MRPSDRPLPPGRRRCLAWLVLPALTAPLAACGTLPQAWEKGILAKPAMSLDAGALESRFLEHVYASKEAASGGGAVGGAGCGCN